MSATRPDGESRNGLRLVDQIKRLEAWLDELGFRHSWQRVALFERDATRGDKDKWAPGGEVAAELMEERFLVILCSATRGWVNLVPVTVAAGTLIVAIEWFSDPSGETCIPEQVSVNFSSELHRSDRLNHPN